MSEIAKCICLKFQNLFVSNGKMYLSQIAKCICLKLPNVFVSNCKIYLSHIAKCICLKLPIVFVLKCKMYLSQIVKFNCVTLQNIFVSNFKMYLSQISKCIYTMVGIAGHGVIGPSDLICMELGSAKSNYFLLTHGRTGDEEQKMLWICLCISYLRDPCTFLEILKVYNRFQESLELSHIDWLIQ